MSRSISLDIELASNEKIPIRTILQTLINLGWNPIFDGTVNHLPVDDNDMYDWTKESLTVEQLLALADLKEQKNEVFGVDVYWDKSQIGASLLIFNQNEMSFSLDINRKFIDGSTFLVDHNWYATRILDGMSSKFNIGQYVFRFVH